MKDGKRAKKGKNLGTAVKEPVGKGMKGEEKLPKGQKAGSKACKKTLA